MSYISPGDFPLPSPAQNMSYVIAHASGSPTPIAPTPTTSTPIAPTPAAPTPTAPTPISTPSPEPQPQPTPSSPTTSPTPVMTIPDSCTDSLPAIRWAGSSGVNGRLCKLVIKHLSNYQSTGRPGSSEVPRNPLTRWDVSSIPANGIFLTKKQKNTKKCPTGGERLNR